jgi:hypothetical protein
MERRGSGATRQTALKPPGATMRFGYQPLDSHAPPRRCAASERDGETERESERERGNEVGGKVGREP